MSLRSDHFNSRQGLHSPFRILSIPAATSERERFPIWFHFRAATGAMPGTRCCVLCWTLMAKSGKGKIPAGRVRSDLSNPRLCLHSPAEILSFLAVASEHDRIPIWLICLSCDGYGQRSGVALCAERKFLSSCVPKTGLVFIKWEKIQAGEGTHCPCRAKGKRLNQLIYCCFLLLLCNFLLDKYYASLYYIGNKSRVTHRLFSQIQFFTIKFFNREQASVPKNPNEWRISWKTW